MQTIKQDTAQYGEDEKKILDTSQKFWSAMTVDIFGDTAIVITDCDYALKMGASSTSHHFAVTGVYVNQADEWKLIQFLFTALVG